jgi:hypothetical protein
MRRNRTVAAQAHAWRSARHEARPAAGPATEVRSPATPQLSWSITETG